MLVEGVFDALAATSIDMDIVGVPLLGKTASAMQLMKLRRYKDLNFVVALDRDARLESVDLALQLYDMGMFRVFLLFWPVNAPWKDPADTPHFLDLLPGIVSEVPEIGVALLRTELISLKERRRREQRRRATKKFS